MRKSPVQKRQAHVVLCLKHGSWLLSSVLRKWRCFRHAISFVNPWISQYYSQWQVANRRWYLATKCSWPFAEFNQGTDTSYRWHANELWMGLVHPHNKGRIFWWRGVANTSHFFITLETHNDLSYLSFARVVFLSVSLMQPSIQIFVQPSFLLASSTRLRDTSVELIDASILCN